MAETNEVRMEELTEEEQRLAEARAKIAELVAAGVEASEDEPRLNELLKAYQVVGDKDGRMRVMRRLMAIPSADERRKATEAIVASIRSGAVDIERIRQVIDEMTAVKARPKSESSDARSQKDAEYHAKALELKKKHGSVTISMLQRELGVGYNRAALILDGIS